MKIGFVLVIADRKELGRPFSWIETRAMAQRAEAAGFDSLWLYDHLLYRTAGEPTVGIWECWTFLSALAEATTHPELGTVVACVPFRNPALLAKMAVTLDEVSGGRLILGIGAGWNAAEFEAFGVPFDHRATRFEEAVKIIKPLLTEGQVDFQGAHYAAKNGELAPRGPRPHGPPLMVGTTGPRMLRLTAQYADSWNMAWLSTAPSIAEARGKMEAACQEVGRDPATMEVTALMALTFPDLGGPERPMAEYITGSADAPEQVAEHLLTYAHMGIAHLMLHVYPYTHTALDRLADAVRIYRERSANE
ncbi:MAG: LLM class flavin-dependent oxidoreductase [Ktedonobacterales bacterium]|nr:LLM class flavin-dependent oxidoreductase [Ktedonobacterales bacterium]